MSSLKQASILWVLAGALLACSVEQPTVLRVGAAASLGDFLPPVLESFEVANPGVEVELSLGGSHRIAQQAEMGAPLDLLFLAGGAPLDRLEEQGLVASGTRTVLLTNSLVLVGPAVESATPVGTQLAEALLGVERIAIGSEAVPAGIYARQWLAKDRIEGALEGRAVLFEDVRAVLAAVASGTCERGFVYKTDAGSEPGVVILSSPEFYPPSTSTNEVRVEYPAAVLAGSVHFDLAHALLGHIGQNLGAAYDAGFFPNLAGHNCYKK